MKLLGINGYKTSGKDTTYLTIKNLVEGVANLDAYPNERVERRAFADNLKIMAMLALGLEGDDNYLIEQADLLKENGRITTMIPDVRFDWPGTYIEEQIKGRSYLQKFGEHARTVFGDTFWVDQVLPRPVEPSYKLDPHVFEPIWGTVGRKGERVGLPHTACVTDVRYPNEAERTLALHGEVIEVVRPGLKSDGHSTEKPLPRELVSHTLINDGGFKELTAKVKLFLDGHRVLLTAEQREALD